MSAPDAGAAGILAVVAEYTDDFNARDVERLLIAQTGVGEQDLVG